MKIFVLEKKEGASGLDKDSQSNRRRRKRNARRMGPEPRCLFKEAEDDEIPSPEQVQDPCSDQEPQDGDSAPEPSSRVPSFKEDDDVFAGRFATAKPEKSPKKTPRRRRQAASASKLPRQNSDLGPTPSKEVEAAGDVAALSQDVDPRLVELPDTLNPSLAIMRLDSQNSTVYLYLTQVFSLLKMPRFDVRIILSIFIQEELKTFDMAYETFTGLQGRLSSLRKECLPFQFMSGNLVEELGKEAKDKFSALTMRGKKFFRSLPTLIQDLTSLVLVVSFKKWHLFFRSGLPPPFQH